MSVVFSIVMPVLNAMPYFERALRSVLSQVGDDTEVIVVDGGSVDGGEAAMRRIAAECSVFSVQCSDGEAEGEGNALMPECLNALVDGGRCSGSFSAEAAGESEKSRVPHPRQAEPAETTQRIFRGVECGEKGGGEGGNALVGGMERVRAGARGSQGELDTEVQQHDFDSVGAGSGQKLNTEYCTLNTAQRSAILRWVSERDGGQSEALNKGFQMARGRYLFWVNGDDLLLPGTMERVREYLKERPGCEWLAGNLVYIDKGDRVIRCAVGEGWHSWLYRSAPVRVYGPTSIFTRELFERVDGFDESLHYIMDTDLWLKFKGAGARFERLDHFCWGFRVHEGSKTSGDLLGRTGEAQAAERVRVYGRHGLRVTWWGLWKQRVWRVVSGCYLRALYESFRRRCCGHGAGV